MDKNPGHNQVRFLTGLGKAGLVDVNDAHELGSLQGCPGKAPAAQIS
jgi:hypothetical protein